jgi:hypothetical protein
MRNSILYPAAQEKRYANYPRRWLVEYHCDRRKEPTTRGACAELQSARTRASRAVDQGFCSVVRIFDRKSGQYAFTYKPSVDGTIRREGYVK